MDILDISFGRSANSTMNKRVDIFTNGTLQKAARQLFPNGKVTLFLEETITINDCPPELGSHLLINEEDDDGCYLSINGLRATETAKRQVVELFVNGFLVSAITLVAGKQSSVLAEVVKTINRPISRPKLNSVD